MSLVSGGQYLYACTIRVVNHQFWLTILAFALKPHLDRFR